VALGPDRPGEADVLDQPPHAGTDLGIDFELPAGPARLGQRAQDHVQAAQIDEAQLRQIDSDAGCGPLEVAEMSRELLRYRHVDLAEQGQAQRAIGINPMPTPKPKRSQELVHSPSSYPHGREIHRAMPTAAADP
jgi:hypothetical protein